MYELTTIVIAASIAALGGLIVGWLIARQKDDDHHQAEQLEEQINELKEQNNRYQEDVTSHFAKTAALLNDLTSNYREVHNHLAEGAQQLASNDQDLLRKLAGPSSQNQEKEIAERITPPLDYAPKNGDQEGILSEKYGLNDNIS